MKLVFSKTVYIVRKFTCRDVFAVSHFVYSFKLIIYPRIKLLRCLFYVQYCSNNIINEVLGNRVLRKFPCHICNFSD